MFSKQHYKTIGYILGKNQADETLINDFIHLFKEDNSLFDTDKFNQFLQKVRRE